MYSSTKRETLLRWLNRKSRKTSVKRASTKFKVSKSSIHRWLKHKYTPCINDRCLKCKQQRVIESATWHAYVDYLVDLILYYDIV